MPSAVTDCYPITDDSILECHVCRTRETGLQARTRRHRHRSDRGWTYPDCAQCGGGLLPVGRFEKEPVDEPSKEQ